MKLALIAAISVAILYAFEIVGEKLFIEDSPTVNNQTLVSITLSILAIAGFLLLPITPISLALTKTQYTIFALTGLISSTSMVLWFYAIEREDASKVGQLASFETVVTALFGIIFFNETPTQLSLIAIGLIIFSIFILVFDRGLARAIVTTKIAVIPMILAVFLWATQDSIINYIALELNIWTIYFWIRTASLIAFLPIALRKQNRINLIKTITQNQSTHFQIFIAAKIATAIAIILSIYAISNGPLSIIAPLLGSYPIFTLLFGLIATKLTTQKIETTTTTHILKRVLSLTVFSLGIILLFQI